MDEKKIQRINELAAKSRQAQLSDSEKAEQKLLRDEYIAAFRQSLTSQLDNTYILDENGNKRKLTAKGK